MTWITLSGIHFDSETSGLYRILILNTVDFSCLNLLGRFRTNVYLKSLFHFLPLTLLIMWYCFCTLAPLIIKSSRGFQYHFAGICCGVLLKFGKPGQVQDQILKSNNYRASRFSLKMQGNALCWVILYMKGNVIHSC
jgi:hypothetical protein